MNSRDIEIKRVSDHVRIGSVAGRSFQFRTTASRKNLTNLVHYTVTEHGSILSSFDEKIVTPPALVMKREIMRLISGEPRSEDQES